MTEVIYVGGYGRSGSSLVDRLAAQRLGGFSGGEICNLFEWAHSHQECTCGAPVTECVFWGPVVDRAVEESGLSLSELASYLQEAELGRGDYSRWQSVWGNVFAQMEMRNVDLIVDSSKNARFRRRAYLLDSIDGVDVVAFIHLYRRLPAVVSSRRKGNNRALERNDDVVKDRFGTFRAVLSWIATNIFSSWVGPRVSGKYIRISYENVISSNGSALYQALNAPLVASDSDAISGQYHNIAGNRMLRSGSDLKLSIDEGWRTDLPRRYKLLCYVIEQPTYRLMRLVELASRSLR